MFRVTKQGTSLRQFPAAQATAVPRPSKKGGTAPVTTG